MAKMIPPNIHADTSSPGEREIFRRLKADPRTEQWTVLHSLDVANHRKQISGEIDFVIIIPSKGVLCVEVKACRRLKRAGGQWYYGNDPHPDPRGPFKQASVAMHSIRKRLIARCPELSHVIFWSAVVFPYLTFSITSEEWHAWQVIDSRQFRTRSIGELFEQVLDQARTFLQNLPDKAWFRPKVAEPTKSQCEAIIQALRPDFEFFESPRSRVKRLQEELKYYTAEQFNALDAMENNPRVAFYGPAGTGKTMLAIEAARRGRNSGRKVLFLCYNRLLGKWLEEQTADLRPQVTCRTLHSHMVSITGLPINGRDDAFWQEELPLAAMEKLMEEEGDVHIFDELIIDEAQDILRDSYLDFLDLSLKGGLSSGRWRLFGDFEKQAIYRAATLSIDQFLKRAPQTPTYSLRGNCRNTPRIAELTHLLGGLSPRYSKVLRPDDQIEPEMIYYSNALQQQDLLISALKKLYTEGFSGSDIVILSPRSGATCAAHAIKKSPWKDRLRTIDVTDRGYIRYGSIHSFKGMEAPAVIVTDIERIGDEESMALFYIAITRALQRLMILTHEDVKTDIRKMLKLVSE